MTQSETGPGFDFSRYCAAIFDLDGTLVHSEHAWEAAKIEVLGHYGLVPSRALLDAYVGRGLAGFVDELFGPSLAPDRRREIGDRIGAAADLLLPEMREAVPGAPELLCRLHDAGLRIAICSSSPRRHIEGALEMLGIAGRIETIVSAAELPRGKPDPLPFSATLAALNLQPGDACVFEDSLPGARSAFAAGLPVLAVGKGCTGPEFAFCRIRAENFADLIQASPLSAALRDDFPSSGSA